MTEASAPAETRARRSLFAWIGGVAAAGIVLASLLVRQVGPADPLADVAKQRTGVTEFHRLVRDGNWDSVYRRMTEPPARTPDAFADLMRAQVRKHGRVVSVVITENPRLLRSRTVPMLEVHESVITELRGRRQTRKTVSYFARRGDRWLFAFSAPG